MTTVTPELDARFRAAAAMTGLLDAAYDIVTATPLGVLGYPPKTLSEAYAPGAPNRMSAPEMSKTPVDTSPRGSIGAGYTQVQDECVTLNPEQSCDVLHQQFDQVNYKLGRARFKDEQARLGAEAADIESDMGGCPN